MRIGFIGLGRMGLPVAANIAAAGHHVQVTDIRLALVDQARTVGLSWQPSAAEAADGADVLITMLPGPDECRTAMLGDNGALAALTTGAVWVDLTSNSPQVGAHIAALAAGRGVQVLDAPVGGDPAAAIAGTLTLFVGGDAQLLESQRPLLAGIADRIWHCGPAGAGYLTKLLVNEMWFAHAVATAEVMLLAGRSGLDLAALQTILAQSAGSSVFVEKHLPALMGGDYLRTFPIDRVVQELQTVSGLARELGLSTAVADAVLAVHHAAQQRFGSVDGELLGVALLEEQAGQLIRRDPR